MATLQIEINLGNAAFNDDPSQEAARILAHWARGILENGNQIIERQKLYDINGIRVGFVRVKE